MLRFPWFQWVHPAKTRYLYEISEKLFFEEKLFLDSIGNYIRFFGTLPKNQGKVPLMEFFLD